MLEPPPPVSVAIAPAICASCNGESCSMERSKIKRASASSCGIRGVAVATRAKHFVAFLDLGRRLDMFHIERLQSRRRQFAQRELGLFKINAAAQRRRTGK